MTIKTRMIKEYYEVNYPAEGQTRTNRELGLIRKKVILDWIFRFRYSSQNVLTTLFTTSENPEENKKIKARISELLERMVKRNEIRKFPLATGLSKVGYCLTGSGFLILQQLDPDREFTRFFTETATLTASNFVHDLAIQAMISERMKNDENEIGFLNEWEVRERYEKGKFFDAIIELTHEENMLTVGLEIELSPKTKPRLHKAILASNDFINEGDVDSVLYLCPTTGLKNSVNKGIKAVKEKYEWNDSWPFNGNKFMVSVSPTLSRLILGGDPR